MYNPQIETLIHVADTRSFSKAADQMYITTVSVILWHGKKATVFTRSAHVNAVSMYPADTRLPKKNG